MILETVKDLWDKINVYPESLCFYDEKENIQETIYFEKGSEMKKFELDYANRKLLDFSIYKREMYIDFGEEVEE